MNWRIERFFEYKKANFVLFSDFYLLSSSPNPVAVAIDLVEGFVVVVVNEVAQLVYNYIFDAAFGGFY